LQQQEQQQAAQTVETGFLINLGSGKLKEVQLMGHN
jgi:hypothetical protein